MNYHHFRFKTVVDWIEVEIQTASPTHFDAIRRRSGLPYVEPMNAGAEGKTATIFNLKIHDPVSWHSIVSAIDKIAKRFALAKPFNVVGIEVALDGDGRENATSEELASVAATFAKFTTHTHVNRRMYRLKGERCFALPSHFNSLVRHLVDGWQIGVGDRKSDCYQHIYFKTTDHNKCLLPVREHRARIEITLRGNMLPCNTHDEWSQCNFAALAKPYFSFRKLRSDLTALEAVSADVTMTIGKRSKRNRKEGGTRLFNKITKADGILNSLARDKLRDLSERWKSNKSRCGIASTKVMACANSGDTNPDNPSKVGKTLTDSNNYLSSDLFKEFDLLGSVSLSPEELLESLLVLSPAIEKEQKRINSLFYEIA